MHDQGLIIIIINFYGAYIYVATSLAYPTLARLREFAEKRVWPQRRGLVVINCHHSILCRLIKVNSLNFYQPCFGAQPHICMRLYPVYGRILINRCTSYITKHVFYASTDTFFFTQQLLKQYAPVLRGVNTSVSSSKGMAYLIKYDALS